MSTVTLHTPGRINGFDTPNRLVMAPMTRCRAETQGVPSALAIEYYVQRAGAGLIITEGTAPSAVGQGYVRTPSIYSPEQVAAWKKITDAVHAKGGRIFVQLMHVGRIGHSANRFTKEPLIAPSAIRAAGQMWTDAQGMQDNDMPRALESREIPGVIDELRAGHPQWHGRRASTASNCIRRPGICRCSSCRRAPISARTRTAARCRTASASCLKRSTP